MARLEPPSITVSRERNRDRSQADRTVVWVRGEHDLATNVSLAATIANAARAEDAAVVIDLSGVTFIDASTVGIIVGSVIRLRSRSQSIELRAPSLRALRVLELCGLTHLIHSPAEVEAPHPTGAAALGTWIEVPSTQLGEVIDPGADQAIVGRPLSDAAVTVEADRGRR